ncbi:MAG: hypothetical protein Ct9H90mP4_10220 [Gammaproteobacteria bacterium]|nr:MAG: hypothetical protein Ct9H90mP4_10220 [Gammaproteobacteria bacterium]
MLGGEDRKTLFISTSKDSSEEACFNDPSAKIEF